MLKKKLELEQERVAALKSELDKHSALSTPRSSQASASSIKMGTMMDKVESIVGHPSHSDLYGTYEVMSIDDHPVNHMVVENILTRLDGFKARTYHILLMFFVINHDVACHVTVIVEESHVLPETGKQFDDLLLLIIGQWTFLSLQDLK